MVETEEKKLSEETLGVIERLCLFDDDFMSLVFERNKEATEYLINTILERDDLKVIEVVGQREYKNPYFGGRVVRVDIYAMDVDGKIYDIEVQRSDTGAVPERARFHSAMVDVRMLKEKQKFKEIKDSYVIFITQNDVIGKGLPLYHAERMIRETNEEFGDGSHIIYVNGAYKNDEDPIGRLVHDFGCVRSADMYSDLLKEQVRYFKETEGGLAEMCEIIEDVAEKSRIATKVDDVKLLVKNAKMTVEKAFDTLEIPEKEREMLLKML